jgi:MFS family permease
MNRLMATAMGLLAISLLALPHVATQFHIVLYALIMGLAGGFVIVIFFTFWGRIFGRSHLGQIQGAAQTLTVIASAIGPIILAECLERTGSYASIFYLLAAVVVFLGICAWFVRLPAPHRQMESLSQ